jgi:hypothetical protein
MLRGRLPAEDGLLLVKALEAARDQLRESGSAEPLPAESSGDEGPEIEEREARPAIGNADALACMAETLLTSGTSQRSAGERYQLVVHVDQDALSADRPDAHCALEEGPAIPAETARRLACDASLVAIAERSGQPLSVGRKTRAIPPALRRALHSRDHGCCFPGCNQRRFVDAHHIEHWARGGETKLSNLLLLCRHHHRMVHEGGYHVEHRLGGGPIFRRPDGRPIPAVPRNRGGTSHELSRRHRENGLAMTPETPVARSAGDRLDYGMAVEGLLFSEGLLDLGPAAPG